jgi:DNA modification methylase
MENKEKTPEVHSRLEQIGVQKTIFGESIPITQFKNLKQKRELKEKILARFKGDIFRSIITPREIDGNKRLDKLARQSQKGDRSSVENTMNRADSYGKKTLDTLSTFPSVLTFAYTHLLSEEGDKVLDLFMGHNSRASDILSLGRKYVGFDVHQFPIDFTRKHCQGYPERNYTLHLQSSESVPYEDNYFDFAFTCPPYADVEVYSKIYDEEVENDLSSFTYEKFLELYKKCISEGFRTLKEGKFFVIVIGDVHKNGKFISLSNDTVRLAEEVGFIFHDENIYNRKSNIGGDLNYKTFIQTCKRFPTIHKYILIFKKPKNSKNPAPTTPEISPQKEPTVKLTRKTKESLTETPQAPSNSCQDCGSSLRISEFNGVMLCEGR